MIKAASAGLVVPRHHVVVLQEIHNELCVKVLSLDETGKRVIGSNGVTSAGCDVCNSAPQAKARSIRSNSAGQCWCYYWVL